jgi:hypothetical protein
MADNLIAICKPNVYKCKDLDDSQPYWPPWPVTGIALPCTLPWYYIVVGRRYSSLFITLALRFFTF